MTTKAETPSTADLCPVCGDVHDAPGIWSRKPESYDLDDRVALNIPVGVEDLPEWEFSIDLANDGRMTRFEARAAEGITARALRSLPLRDMQRVARVAAERAMVPLLFNAAQPDSWEHHDELRSLYVEFQQERRPGRRGRPDRSYAAFAAEYVRLLSETDNPVLVMARQLNFSASQVRNILNTARSKKLLTAAPIGRAGGELTDKALRLLKEGND